MATPMPFDSTTRCGALQHLYQEVRRQTRGLVAPLSDADATVQSMPDASPAKWHLAHTTWFFETMVLLPHAPGYKEFDSRYAFLFNSYYESMGARHARPKRGLLTRPTLEEIQRYRAYVDAALVRVMDHPLSPALGALIELGCHHEQQHQELLLTDILHLFSENPMRPAYSTAPRRPRALAADTACSYTSYAEATVEIGHTGTDFAFDCEEPRHRVIRPACRIANRCVTNREWLEFMADGGYEQPLIWLSDGWTEVQRQTWKAPLYWWKEQGVYFTMTLQGAQALELDAPVTHVSYFEADAYATWRNQRLPTELEWEAAAQPQPVAGNFADSGLLRPLPSAASGVGPQQLFGDVWEWTRSSFSPYPGFRTSAGAVGEYNGKFMSGQYVLRGGSCVTPANHIRATYRNFFRPDARWQFSGVRLAEDV
jgi:ergothioneine biosynthesis protein EgtB